MVCSLADPAPLPTLLPPSHQFVDYGDLSYLHRDAYEAALRAELAEAEPFEFSYKRNAPKPQVGGWVGGTCRDSQLGRTVCDSQRAEFNTAGPAPPGNQHSWTGLPTDPRAACLTACR